MGKNEVNIAFKARKQNARGARASCSKIRAQLESMIQAAERGDGASALKELLAESASDLTLDAASDCQQGRNIPSWRKSLQPGVACFMPKAAHCAQKFCPESRGARDGDSRLGRNFCCARSKEDGGSKRSDGALSTLAGILLSLSIPACKQPSSHREGRDKDGEELPAQSFVEALIATMLSHAAREKIDIAEESIHGSRIAEIASGLSTMRSPHDNVAKA